MNEEVSVDLIRLCTLLHQKNEIQALRHRARHAERRFANILSMREALKKKAALERVADMQKNVSYIKLTKISTVANSMGWGLSRHLVTPLVEMEKSIKEEAAKAQKELDGSAWYLTKASLQVSAKYKKAKSSDIKILMRQQHIANEQAKLDIALFTKTNRKEMAQICKRNGWKVTSNAQSAYYECVIVKDGWKRLVKGREEIKAMAAGQVLEDAILS